MAHGRDRRFGVAVGDHEAQLCRCLGGQFRGVARARRAELAVSPDDPASANALQYLEQDVVIASLARLHLSTPIGSPCHLCLGRQHLSPQSYPGESVLWES
jgi:hypothetical protein